LERDSNWDVNTDKDTHAYVDNDRDTVTGTGTDTDTDTIPDALTLTVTHTLTQTDTDTDTDVQTDTVKDSNNKTYHGDTMRVSVIVWVGERDWGRKRDCAGLKSMLSRTYKASCEVKPHNKNK